MPLAFVYQECWIDIYVKPGAMEFDPWLVLHEFK